MKEPEIYRELTTILRDVFDDDGIIVHSGTSARDIPDWDSQAHINVVVATEMRFGIRFRTAELEDLHNVGDFVRLIGLKLS